MTCTQPISPRRRLIVTPRAAFTLVEVLGVVVILGIVSAIIIPQIGSRSDQKAAAAARVLVADLLYAQNRAIATQKTHYVQFDVAGGTYKILDTLSPPTTIRHPVTGANYQVWFGATSTNGLGSMQLTSANLDGQTTLAFDALGVPYSYNATTGTAALNSGNVVVSSGTYALTVTVSPFSGELTVH